MRIPLWISLFIKQINPKGNFHRFVPLAQKVSGYIAWSILRDNPLSVQEYTSDYW